jgi:hypothetical protein
MSGEKKELSQLAKTILGGAGHITTFTQSEFDEALALAKAEIMQVAIETTKHAIFIERDECAKIAEAEGQTELADKIRNRIPTQRQ